MSSHFARLKDELDARQLELQEKEATVESIEKLTKELESQKQALEKKSAELDAGKNDIKAMQRRLEALSLVETTINNAMHTKSSTEDIVAYVLERAIRSNHLTCSDIFKSALRIAVDVNNGTHSDNLKDLLTDLIDDNEGLKAAVDSAMASLEGVNDMVKYTLATALKHGLNAADLTDSVAKTVYTMLGDKTSTVESSKETPTGTVESSKETPTGTVESSKETPAVKPPKENAPPGGQPQATPGNKNGLRGQAEDFMSLKDQNGSYNSKGWEAFARRMVGSGQA